MYRGISEELLDFLQKSPTAFHAVENIKKELKKRARSIANRLLKSNQEEKLVDFLKLDLLSDHMLASLQKTAQENGMTTVSAYILNEQNKKLLKKESSKNAFRI